jgi:hypothetical protein
VAGISEIVLPLFPFIFLPLVFLPSFMLPVTEQVRCATLRREVHASRRSVMSTVTRRVVPMIEARVASGHGMTETGAAGVLPVRVPRSQARAWERWEETRSIFPRFSLAQAFTPGTIVVGQFSTIFAGLPRQTGENRRVFMVTGPQA